MTNDQYKKRDESTEQELVKAVDDIASSERGMLERIGGPLMARQKKQLENLGRLHRSLRGPEDVLDEANYSRPFPPTKRKYENT